MKVVRTFVAVLIDEDLKARISGVQDQVRKLAPGVKWVAPESLHVTLKFLGNVEEDTIPRVIQAVDDAVRPFHSFDLSVSGVGAFPNPDRARVFWVGIEDGREQLANMVLAVDASLLGLGFEKEKRPFKPHITIGRVREGKSAGRIGPGMREIDAGDLGTQRVTSVAVMQSELLREGPAYSPLGVSKLQDE